MACAFALTLAIRFLASIRRHIVFFLLGVTLTLGVLSPVLREKDLTCKACSLRILESAEQPDDHPRVAESPLPTNPTFEAGNRTAALDLLARWREQYSLDNVLSEDPLQRCSQWWCPAPHLRDCAAVAAQSSLDDSRGANEELPAWMASPAESNPAVQDIWGKMISPQPPWIVGSDAANLERTRDVQAAIWLHQHPPNCSSPDLKFLLVDWWNPATHGLGSAIHGMGMLLALALRLDRVLVNTATFDRARHPRCRGDQSGSLDCYYLPITSPECSAQAIRLNGKAGGVDLLTGKRPPSGLRKARAGKKLRSKGVLPGRWQDDGRPVLKPIRDTSNLRYRMCPDNYFPDLCTLGTLNFSDEGQGTLQGFEIDWWRAQATRYILRYPSQYLCRLENQARHLAFGDRMAAGTVAAWERRLALAESAPHAGEQPTVLRGQLEDSLWRAQGVQIPRPIVSIHIRGGRKGVEMTLWPMSAYMQQAERVRRHHPATRSIWLSTMRQVSIEETALYPAWTFHFTQQQRLTAQQEGVMDTVPEGPPGGAKAGSTVTGVGTDMSFVNLLVASECDYFVGTLASNWDRLIDEMRKTNGRQSAGYIGLNLAQV